MKDKLDEAAGLLFRARSLLLEVQPNLTRADDAKIIKTLITDLAWANENCTVIGLHQIGMALEDTMAS